MKKIIYFLFLLIFIPVSVLGEITGDGTYGNPYTGTLTTGSFTINTTPVYFDQIGVSGGILVIEAGTTLFAVNTTSQITITSTGSFYAIGTPGNIITFSADNNGNGITDAGETWGNIYFNGSSGTSVIDYSLIEYAIGRLNFGSGVRIAGTNITLSNSTIRNCFSATDGGGVYARPYPPTTGIINLVNLNVNNNSGTTGGGIYIYASVNITGCEIYGNTASTGAGIYFRTTGSISNSLIHDNIGGAGVYSAGADASGSITNCILYNNGVGIYFYGQRNVVNCDVVNNSTGIISGSSTAPKVVNTVLWGNTTQYSLESGAQMELANCGIQGGFSVGTDGLGNKTLDPINGAVTGPNFVNTSLSNYHINSWISPLVDGGTPSYSGVTVPGTDIEGKSRIGTLDIGAYEFIYYIWTGITSTDWLTSSNWTGSPSTIPTSIIANKVIIPNGCPNYPTVASLSLSTGSILTIEPQAGLTVTGATTVGSGCTFLLKSDVNGSANFITGSSVPGTYNVELFLSGGGGTNYYKWHYVTTPVDGIGKAVLTSSIGNAYNLLNYIESKVSTDKMQGWNWYDGYSGSAPFNTLRTDFGYNVYVTSDQTAVFSGTILAGSEYYNTNITCGTLAPDLSGWNLVGNPFTSSVDINYLDFGTDVESTVYFTKNNSYSSYNTYTHSGINGATNIISPLQGFFVHVLDGLDQIVGIPATSRLYSSQPLQKGLNVKNKSKGSISYPILKLNVSDGDSLTDEALIYFFNDATVGYDRKYDGYKMFSNNTLQPQIYSTENSINLGMNGLPFPDKITTVPLNIRIGVARDYTINVLNLENLNDCKVTLIHGTNRIDLKANPSYTFSAVVGTITDMAVEFDMSVPTDVNVPSKDQTECWYSNGNIFIKTDLAGFADNSTVLIYDLNGKVVFSKSNISLVIGETVEIPVSLNNGFYITSVTNKNIRLAKKMVISY
jgi:hypothetical protein